MKAWLIALGAVAVALGGGWMILTFLTYYDLDIEDRRLGHIQELWSGLLGVVGIAIILLASAYL